MHGLDNPEYHEPLLRNDACCPFAVDSMLPNDYNSCHMEFLPPEILANEKSL